MIYNVSSIVKNENALELINISFDVSIRCCKSDELEVTFVFYSENLQDFDHLEIYEIFKCEFYRLFEACENISSNSDLEMRVNVRKICFASEIYSKDQVENIIRSLIQDQVYFDKMTTHLE